MKTENTIEIAICLHARDENFNYVKSAAALIASIEQRTTSKIRYNIIHDDSIRPQILEKLQKTAPTKFRFININRYPTIREFGVKYNSNFSPAVIWRIFIDQILDKKYIISLDADLICLCNINEIWKQRENVNIISAPLRKVKWDSLYLDLINTTADKYFRMTIATLNLEGLRKCDYFEKERFSFLQEKLENINKIRCLPEQSVFNFFFSEINEPLECCVAPIDRKYLELQNSFTDSSKTNPWSESFVKQEALFLDMKGWISETPYSLYYWAHLLHTPWMNEINDVWDTLKPNLPSY